MRIEHIAIYVQDLEKMKSFYEKYFSAKANNKYHNSKSRLYTYFLRFDTGARLVLMMRSDLDVQQKTGFREGYTHLAFSAGSKGAVDSLTARLESDGYKVISGPRTTSDGYYESSVLDPENNQIEITE